MLHKFDTTQWARLDAPERKTVLPVDMVIASMGIMHGQQILDIGAGIGYFTFPAATAVGIHGEVTAIDTSADMITELNRRVALSESKNIHTHLSEEYVFPVGTHHFDGAIMCLVIHEIEAKEVFLKETFRTLKSGGKLAIIEWIKEPMEKGPPIHERLSETELIDIIRTILPDAKFREKRLSELYYLLIIEKD